MGFKPLQALINSFVPGLSEVLGATIVNLVPVSQPTIGLMFAFGEGGDVHLASVVCMPQVALLTDRWPEPLRHPAFALGTVLIGLILLDHRCFKECGAAFA